MWTDNDKLIFFRAVKEHHRIPDGAAGDNRAIDLINSGNADYAAIANRIRAGYPFLYGAQVQNPVTQQNVCQALHIIGGGARKDFVGRKLVLLDDVKERLITTLVAVIVTCATLFTTALLQPIAIGIIVAMGCEHYLTDSSSGNFNCSR